MRVVSVPHDHISQLHVLAHTPSANTGIKTFQSASLRPQGMTDEVVVLHDAVAIMRALMALLLLLLALDQLGRVLQDRHQRSACMYARTCVYACVLV